MKLSKVDHSTCRMTAPPAIGSPVKGAWRECLLMVSAADAAPHF